MSRHRSLLLLTDQERDALQTLVRTGTHAARTILRAHILLLSATGAHTVAVIASRLGVCPATVYNVRARYRDGGLATALYDQPRSGFPRRVTPREEAQITMLACSAPPAGRSRWTIRLLTDRFVELSELPLSHESVRQVLKKVT